MLFICCHLDIPVGCYSVGFSEVCAFIKGRQRDWCLHVCQTFEWVSGALSSAWVEVAFVAVAIGTGNWLGIEVAFFDDELDGGVGGTSIHGGEFLETPLYIWGLEAHPGHHFEFVLRELGLELESRVLYCQCWRQGLGLRAVVCDGVAGASCVDVVNELGLES